MSDTPSTRRRVAAVARRVLALVGGTLDGFVAGFAIGYVAAVTLSGLDRGYGFAPVVDAILTGLLAIVVVGLLWALFAGLITLAAKIRDRLRPRLERSRLPRPVTSLMLLPLRLVAALPRLGIGLLAAVLVVVYGIVPSGIGGILGPDGPLAPWIWFSGFVGAALGLARTALLGLPGPPGIARRAIAALGLVAAVALGAWGVAMALDPGSTAHLVAPDPVFDGERTAGGLDDPGAPGPYAVTAFSYGSGTDRRPEYGADARFRTPTVDASLALPVLDWFGDAAREWLLGFGTDELPLNALVWMPEGDGPFPLVLVVHGNHAMSAPSEAGYAYLGEHLASRGFITVSVDETFLNGSWSGDYEGAEQDVRAWMLLLHLDQWRRWNEDPASPLAGTADLDRVALIGHSRGGEAAAIAASWAGIDAGFDVTLSPWPSGLDVRAVVAIAPSDGQIGHDVRLDGVDLLELTGGHDADARAWSGIRQYNRATVGDGAFKAAFYAQRANHGQFNTEWGAGDFGRWSGTVLDLAALPSAAEQQDLAKTVIGAFLEASLHDEEAFRGLFRRPMTGRAWLPDDVYAVRSDDGEAEPLYGFDGGGAAADGLEAVRDGLAAARVMMLPLRALQDVQGGKGAQLEWDAGDADPGWGVEGIAGSGAGRIAAAAGAELRLDVATAADAPGEPPARPLDLVVEASTTDGVSVSLPLAAWGAMPPPLEARLDKHAVPTRLAAIGGLDISLRTPAEHVVQSYAIPLAAFADSDPAFQPDRLDGVVVRLPGTRADAIVITALGLAPGPAD